MAEVPLPRLTALGLRLRIALFFGLIGVAGACAVLGGALLAMLRGGEVLDTVVLSALVGCLGLWAVTVWVALRFDQNIAQPIDHLSSELRLRAEGVHGGDIDTSSGQYLGALGPTIANTNIALRRMRETFETELSERTQDVQRAVDVLADILSTVPSGLLAATRDHRISHLNGPAVQLLSREGPVGLDRDLRTLIDPISLETAYQRLLENDAPTSLTFDALTLGTNEMLPLRIALLHTDGVEGGYVLALPDAQVGDMRTSTLHDAGLHSRDESDLAERSFVVFDSETTGLDPAGGDALVQLSGVRVVNGRRVIGDVFDTFVDPGRTIPPRSTEIHGVTDAMVAGAPGPEEAVAAFHLWCGDSVLVAHNTAFDLAFLRQVEPGARCSFDHDVLDTVHLSALCFPHEADHTLDALMDRLGVIWDTADRHTALGDSKMTAECLLRLLPLLKTQGLSSLEDIAAARSGLGQIIRAQAAYERD